MKFSFVAIALAMIVAVNALEESEPQMHRRLVQVTSPNNSKNQRGGGVRGAAASRPSTSLLDELNKMPVPQPVKTKKAD